MLAIGNNCSTNGNNVESDEGEYCDSIWDTVSCWPKTRAGHLTQVSCPLEFDGVLIDQTANATRLCYGNASWQLRSDYTQCKAIEADKLIAIYYQSFISRIIYYVGFTLSIVALSAALVIFLYFRSLRCVRNTIHCHLIVTFLLRNILWITMDRVLPILADDSDSDPTSRCLCKLILVLYNYLQLTNFFWMLVEGLHLRMMIERAFTAAQTRVWTYCITGWGTPTVFIVAWAVVKATFEDVSCWLPMKTSHFEYIYIAPILCVLLINLLILFRIAWILVTKLRESSSVQSVLYRKAIKSTLVLFPLLGVTYILFITHPTDSQASRTAFLYFNSVLQSIQGLLVAIFYCFLNVEVQDAVLSRTRRWRDIRNVGRRRASDGRAFSVTRQEENFI